MWSTQAFPLLQRAESVAGWKWLAVPSTYLGVLVGVDSSLHTKGLGAQDLTVPLQGVELEQVGSRQQLVRG